MSSQGSYQEAFVSDNFIPVIPVDGDVVHTDLYPFCLDPTCDCHEDEYEIAVVEQAILDGLITSSEATDFVSGKLL